MAVELLEQRPERLEHPQFYLPQLPLRVVLGLEILLPLDGIDPAGSGFRTWRDRRIGVDATGHAGVRRALGLRRDICRRRDTQPIDSGAKVHGKATAALRRPARPIAAAPNPS
jgi:hypothetical protein